MKLIIKPKDIKKQIDEVFRILPEENKEGKCNIEFWMKSGIILTFEDLEITQVNVLEKIEYAKTYFKEIRRIYLDFPPNSSK